MKIWLLEENEKRGPYESFSVRERVANGELGADTLAWYDGADGWVSLGDVPTMVSAFPREEGVEVKEVVDGYVVSREESYRHGVDIPEHLQSPPRLHAGRRLFARLVDVVLYFLVLFSVMAVAGMDIYGYRTPTQGFLFSLPYVLVDSLSMHLFGTTVGKYFLNVSVRCVDGSRLSLGASLLRSMRVWVVGLGMFTPMMPITFLFSWMISRKFGKFLWDLPKNTVVDVRETRPLKVVLVCVILFSAVVVHDASIPDWMRLKGDSVSEQMEDLERRMRPE